MKKMALGVFLVLAAVCFRQQAQAQTLTWEIMLSRERRTWEYIHPIPQTIPGENNDIYRIDIKPSSDCFCYAVFYDSELNVSPAFDNPPRFDQPMKGGVDTITITFDISGSGIDTVYIIMSLKRQEKLESLIQAYNRNPDTQRQKDIYLEVINLQNTARGSGEPTAKPIISGGTSRSGGSSENNATQYSDKDLYVRSISIRH
jgi:hypothetical protein